MNIKTCKVENCIIKHRAKGYCHKHYIAWKKYGTSLKSQKSKICKVEGCNKKHKGHGYCNSHYVAWKRYGESLKAESRATGNINAQGYRRIKVNKKSMLEHRHFMEQHLGRKLIGTENVHHRNGDRLDNTIGPCALLRECKCEGERHNLELWPTAQPSGKRVEDLLAYSEDIQRLYGKNKIAYEEEFDSSFGRY